MLTVHNISLAFGKRLLFDEVNLGFVKGNCYGIIGANGAGKSTFIKILSGEIEPNKGHIGIAPNNRMAVLKQNHSEFNECSVLNSVLMGHKQLWKIFKEREDLYAKADFSEADGNRAGELESEFGEMGGYTAESDAATLLSALGIEEPQHLMLMQNMSGNQKVKILLAQALFGNPDILLLDEPTNNMDADTITWLENFLAEYQNIVLVVSHDRHFLDTVCTHVVDIDKQKARIYTGNYTFWYESSQLASKQSVDKNKKLEDKRKDLLDFIARFSANASKSKQATSRKKALEKIVLEDIQPSSRKYPGIFFKSDREVGNQILDVKNLCQSIDGIPLFSNVSFVINKADKIGVISKNPIAVNYFFDIINQVKLPDAGNFEWGTTVTKAYLPVDNNSFFKENLSLMDWLRQYVPENVKDVDEPFLRGFLGRMLFGGDEVFKNTQVLSGGEKMRCMISRVMMQNANVITFDQPTNHLDLESITAFNNGVLDFKGIVFIATHDHQFMQSTTNRIIELTPKGIIDRLMNYDEYFNDPKVKQLQAEMY